MIDQTTTLLLSFAGAIGIVTFELWLFKLAPFTHDVLGEVTE